MNFASFSDTEKCLKANSFPWHMQKTSIFNAEKIDCSLSFLSFASGYIKILLKNILFC